MGCRRSQADLNNYNIEPIEGHPLKSSLSGPSKCPSPPQNPLLEVAETGSSAASEGVSCTRQRRCEATCRSYSHGRRPCLFSSASSEVEDESRSCKHERHHPRCRQVSQVALWLTEFRRVKAVRELHALKAPTSRNRLRDLQAPQGRAAAKRTISNGTKGLRKGQAKQRPRQSAR